MEVTRSSEEQAGGDCSKECSMCGDVGFSTELFQCKKCFYRWQHTYCSRLYPNVGSGKWVKFCDWCFQADDAKPHRASRAAKRKAMASSNSSPSRYSGSEVVEWSQYDALEFLLEVAQSASSDGLRETCVERQACSSKRTSARKCTGFSPKRQQRCGVNDRSLEKWQQQFSKPKLPTMPAAAAASKGIGGRRYKLLSDVLC